MRRGLLLLVIAVLVPAAAVAAAEPAVVARDGNAVLRAYRQGHDLCLESAQAQSCASPPSSPSEPVTLDDDDGLYGAAVVPEVASVEIERRDGSRRALPTVTAPGFRSRFVVFRRAGRIALVRFFAADGRLLGAAQQDLVSDTPTSVLRAFHDGTTVQVIPRLHLDPTVTQLDRVVASQCLVVGDASPSCTDDVRRSVVTVCGNRSRVVFGALPAAARHVVLTLGDGRTAGTDTVTLPDGTGFALEVPTRLAVRTLRAVDSAGHAVGGGTLGFPPCRPRFGNGQQDLPLRQPLDTAPVTVAEANGHPLAVATSGETICAGVDRPQRPCFPAPVDDAPFIVLRRGDTVGGVVPEATSTVAVRRIGGPDTVVATVADARIPNVRFFIAAAPPGTKPIVAIAKDADGQQVGGGGEAPTHFDDLRTLTRRRGQRLVAIEGDFLGERLRCVGALPPLGANGFCAERDPYDTASAAVGCQPAQTMVYGRIKRGAPVPVVRVGHGRAIPVRVLRTIAGRAFVAFPPPRATLRSVTIGGRTVHANLPPATEQRGYGATLEDG